MHTASTMGSRQIHTVGNHHAFSFLEVVDYEVVEIVLLHSSDLSFSFFSLHLELTVSPLTLLKMFLPPIT